MSRTFSSLAFRPYRRFFAGVTASNLGMWMTRTAQAWLVLVELTHGDAQALGFVTSAMFLPTLLLTPVAGTLADRFPKRRIMLVAQVVLFVDIVLLASLTLTGTVQLWHVFALAFSDGVAGAFDGPSRQAIVSELVPRDAVSNAIGLNSTSFNAARLLGPGAAGALIFLIGTGPVFVVNAVTFVIQITCLLGLPRIKATRATPKSAVGGGMLTAIRYVWRRADLRLLFSIALAMGIFGFNFQITNPLMATQEFGKGAGEFGALGSIMGIGSLTAALMAAQRPRPRIRHVAFGLLAFSMAMTLSAAAPSFGLFTLLMIPLGLTSVSIMVSANALIQMGVTAEVRGRVMALWGAVILGFAPVVSPLIGWIGNAYGARATVWFSAVGITAVAIAATIYLVVHEGIEVHMTRRRPWLVLETRTETG